MTNAATASQRVFDADLARFDKMFREADAICEGFDGVEHFTYIDTTKVPAATVSAYNRLASYGFANGLMP